MAMLSSINEGGIGHCAWELGLGCRFWQISSGGCLLSLGRGGGLAFGACFSGGGGVGGAGGAWVGRGDFVFVVVQVLFGIAGD